MTATVAPTPGTRNREIMNEVLWILRSRRQVERFAGETSALTRFENNKRMVELNEITVCLTYSKRRFGVPRNLLILRTMNTADRSIALLNIALWRRFTFVEMPPQPE